VTQSVELLLDPVAEAAVRQEWVGLHSARLPTELRSNADESHRPHITLYAGDTVTAEMDAALDGVVADLVLPLRLGALTLFGPHRERFVLVHAVVPSVELLEVQRRVAAVCRADPTGHFGAGHWTPHVTLARRLPAAVVGDALTVLTSCSAVGQPARVTRCRRWDSVARRTWLLGGH